MFILNKLKNNLIQQFVSDKLFTHNLLDLSLFQKFMIKDWQWKTNYYLKHNIHIYFNQDSIIKWSNRYNLIL